MHGITHLYRQHAIEKQLSADCWQSGGSTHTAYARSYGRDNGSMNSSTEYGSAKGSSRLSSADSSSSSSSSTISKSPNWSQGKQSITKLRECLMEKKNKILVQRCQLFSSKTH